MDGENRENVQNESVESTQSESMETTQSEIAETAGSEIAETAGSESMETTQSEIAETAGSEIAETAQSGNKEIAHQSLHDASKAMRKERKERWKAAKKKHREELKERYKDAPWIIRIPRVYLLKPFVTGFICILLAGGLVFGGISLYKYIVNETFKRMYENRNNPVDTDKIYALSPIDEEGAQRIDAYAPIGEDETWAIYVYIIGSDLEDIQRNQLSQTTKSEIEALKQERTEEEKLIQNNRLVRFSEELAGNGLTLPDYLYYPDTNAEAEETKREDRQGAASIDMEEMMQADLSDNINIVVQTGGARRWTQSMVNPNRTQRFLINSEGAKELVNLPLQRATDPNTIAEFFTYCQENYPADHTMVVFWDHGGGPFGYGYDTIYGGSIISMKEIREALAKSFKPNDKDRPVDIIGFDACLMSNLEVMHDLDGFADFYALSAEAEPGDGWDYTSILNTMSENPTFSPAAVARTIADTYMDWYMTQNVNLDGIISSDVTFSVLDARKAEELYDAYCELTKKQLIDAAADSSVLSEIGRCAGKSTHFVTVVPAYNLADLGNYMDYMVDSYPEESTKIDELLHDTVLYYRKNGCLSDCEGVSVYIPAKIDSYSGLKIFLNYVYDVCEDESTAALYYYKIAGCLNDDMLTYVDRITDDVPQVLDTTEFYNFTNLDVDCRDGGFSIEIGEELQNRMQGKMFELYDYDEESNSITEYGKDECVTLDGDGKIISEFDGTWFYLDKTPLAVEITSSTASTAEYRSLVNYNGQKAYLVFSLDRDTEEYRINGIRVIPDEDTSTDSYNYLVNTKMNLELKAGDMITPVYSVQNFTSGEKSEVNGKSVRFGSSTGIMRKSLKNGYYPGVIAIFDQRGDEYYSQVVGHTVSGGKISKTETDSLFFGRAY